MKALVASLAALALALALAVFAPSHLAVADPAAGLVPQHVLPAAPSKTTKPKPKPKPTATPTPTASPSASVPPRRQTAAEEEGERWVQIAMVAGGGLLGSMALFFGIGTLLRRRPRPKA